MSDNLENNPFVALFPSIEEARNYAATHSTNSMDGEMKTQEGNSDNKDLPAPTIPAEFVRVNDKIEKIFGISFNEKSKNSIVLLKDVAPSPNQVWIDLDTLEQVLFERLLLSKPSLIKASKNAASTRIIEEKCINYLFGCYEVITSSLISRKNDSELETMERLVIRNIATALKQPEFFEGQEIMIQFAEIFRERCDVNSYESLLPFLNKLVDEMIQEEVNPLDVLMSPFSEILKLEHLLVSKSNLSTFSCNSTFGLLLLCSMNKYTAQVLIEYNTPKDVRSGSVFNNTLFGSILCLSCLPKLNSGEHEFFGKDQRLPNSEGPIWSALARNNSYMYSIFYNLLKASPEVKQNTLSWIELCLKSNSSRGKLWSTHGNDPLAEFGLLTVSDGFMLNFCSVLLRLCQPIIANPKGNMYLRIDPTFPAWNGFESETCLIPCEKPEERPKSQTYNFVSQIFFLTHRSLDMGFRVCVEKVVRLNQELQRMVRAYQDAEASAGMSHEVTEAISERVDAAMVRFLSLKAALLEPTTLDLLSNLHVTTSRFLVRVMLHQFPADTTLFLLPQEDKPIFPLPDVIPNTLSCIPEFLLENLNSFLPFAKRFNAEKFDDGAKDMLEPIVTMMIVAMRSNQRVKNPHLRAGLAGCLESLLPEQNSDAQYIRVQVFEDHPHIRELVPSLLDVFVSIEMTGQSVQFDQKFNYRRPIYVLMDYLWKVDAHKNCFKRLAREAEKNMEAVDPPIFLRFLNLLINDAVYLLDEVLSNMAKIKTMQTARDSGEWATLPVREREQNESMFTHTGMIARFDNILGKWTINTLLFLTSEIKSIFVHPTMVDRIAAMLNYFLHHLVGPNMKNFKVKQAQEQYDFRPGDLVKSITSIYLHLSRSDEFCLAVSRDGRSYNDKLFMQTEEVLHRIQASHLVPDLRIVAERVAAAASQQKRKEEMLADAPEEFLDPIMSTLMIDPVVLPSSHVTVDRSTIARHLLSDQIDPFNRAPLTMDMVKPDNELRGRIETWIKEREGSTSKMDK